VLQKLSSPNGAVGIQLPSFWSRKDQIKQLFYLLLSRRDLPKELWPWEIVADRLSKTGWSLGWVSAVDCQGEQSGLLTRTATTESLEQQHFTISRRASPLWRLFVSRRFTVL
jgi:hypothetical protein